MIDEFTSRAAHRLFLHGDRAARRDPDLAGGLGVLAGDTVALLRRSRLPWWRSRLVSRAGYFRQEIEPAGRQVEQADAWDPRELRASRWRPRWPCRSKDAQVWVARWLYVLEGRSAAGCRCCCSTPTSTRTAREDREHHPSSLRRRRALPAQAGDRAGHRRGRACCTRWASRSGSYHMNEGHSALLALELLRRYRLSPRGAAARREPLRHAPRARAVRLHHPHAGGGRPRPVRLRRWCERMLGDLRRPRRR